MFELNFYSVLLLPLVCSILYLAFLRLRTPLEYRQLSSRIPSVTKTFWSEIKFSINLGLKHPRDVIPFLTGIVKNNGPIVHFNLLGRSYVILNDPDDLKTVLSNIDYIKKGYEYSMLQPWLNDGLLLSTGSKWQMRRKLLTNSFHFKNLEMYNKSINKHSRVLVKKLLDASAQNGEISIIDYVTLCSLDIICETIMGTEINAQDGNSVKYVYSIKSACRSVIDRIFKFWLWNDLIFKLSKCGRTFYESIGLLHSYTENVIKHKQLLFNNSENTNALPEGKKQTKSFLDILLNVSKEQPDQMPYDGIREEVETFLFEGHDTSSISIIMTLTLLALHPDIQNEARNELREIFDNSDRDVTFEDLNAMKYLEAIIKESLRLYPSVPAFSRQLDTNLRIKGYNIPPITTICVYPFILHRNEEIYSNPEEFIPKRFLDESNKLKFLFGYLPFSAGPRNCIGQKYAMNQMKIIISTILRKTRVETLGSKDDIQISAQLILRIESLPNIIFHKI